MAKIKATVMMENDDDEWMWEAIYLWLISKYANFSFSIMFSAIVEINKETKISR